MMSLFAVIGKSVNLAARLMSNYPKRIACDDNTRTLSNLDQQDFHQLPYIKVKSEEEIRGRGRKRNEDVKKADKKKEREREREREREKYREI